MGLKKNETDEKDEYIAKNSQNQNIVDEFKKLLKQIKYDIDSSSGKEKQKNMFRLQQTKKVFIILMNFSDPIKSASQLDGIAGVGDKSKSRITEILNTGKLSEIKIGSKYDNIIKYIEDLETVHGIGRNHAYELVTKYGIKNVTELKKAYKSGKIELNDIILKGLKYHGVFQTNIPRSEVYDIDIFLHSILKEIDPELIGLICGSYRRLKITSNDIDFMIVHPKVKTKQAIQENMDKNNLNYMALFIKKLIKKKFIVDSLTSYDVETKYMGFCQLDSSKPIRRIDIRYIPYTSYYPAMLYFTGSGSFNKKMRQHAIQLGYMLNEYGIYKVNKDKIKGKTKKRIPVNSEKEIFNILGLEYLTPDLRI